jgi:cob(I)alamin adenosyltransferase
MPTYIVCRLARCHCNQHAHLQGLSQHLLQIQKHLQTLNSHLAAPKRSFDPSNSVTAELEELIDAWSGEMAELREFLLPGGSECAAVLQLARAVCRRAERSFFAFLEEKSATTSTIEGGMFLNRLSDFLFTAARYANFKLQVRDISFK